MTWAELPAKLKVYISLLTIFAIPILIGAGLGVINSQYDYKWTILTILTLITVLCFQYLPSASVTITIGDAYIMAIAMMYGVDPCIVATFCHTTLISIFARKPRIPTYRIIFNTSSMICGAFIYGNIFHAVNKGNTGITDIFLPAILMVASYFLINSAYSLRKACFFSFMSCLSF